MANSDFFSTLKPGAVFLNTSRGDVVEEESLKRALALGIINRAVLDVWQGEPRIDTELVEKVFLATAHIAGYSAEGKIKATAMIYDAFCQWLNRSVPVSWIDLLPPPFVPQLDLTGSEAEDETLLRPAIRQVYDIRRDDQALRESIKSSENRAVGFDLLRDKYYLRREFNATRAKVADERPSLVRKASGLGFHVEAPILRSNE
jgi:erythronate-4-phosphate dehydrogenase